MQVVHQVREVLRRPPAAAGREVARRLVAPGAVERVLHHRHELDVREAHLLDVFGQRLCQLPVREPAVAVLRQPPPGADVHLVDRDGRLQARSVRALGQPAGVGPGLLAVPDDGGGARRRLGVDGERISLLDFVAAVPRLDPVLVPCPGADARHEPFPDAGAAPRPQRVRAAVPAVEVADHADARGTGRPDREVGARHAIVRHDVRAQLVVQPQVAAFVEQEQVVFRQQRKVVSHVRFGKRHAGSSNNCGKPVSGIRTQSGRLFNSYAIS